MQLRYMQEFLALVEYGSITRAAEALDMSQPVLSKHLQAIEDTVGSQLFVRTKKGIKLTPIGHRACSAFSSIVSTYDQFIDGTLSADSTICGQLRIGILSAGANQYVLPYVNRFGDLHPNVTFTYSTETPAAAINHIVDKSLDLAFYADPCNHAMGKVSFHHIADDPIRLVVPADSPLAEKETIDPEDVADKTLICLRIPESTKTLNELTFSAGYTPKRTQYVDVVEVVVSALQKTGGYFISPDFMCKFFSSPAVKISTPTVPLSLGIYFAYRTKDRSPLVSLFLDTLSQPII